LSRYPQSLHAVVFELGGILWFYCDVDGTQSFSLHRDRLADEKNDFGPLLRAIDPGFEHWSVVADAPSAPAAGSELPNGCFIESVAALHRRLANGVAVIHPQLLSYYFTDRGRQCGHTVLTYVTPRGVELVDPTSDTPSQCFGKALARNPLVLAQTYETLPVNRARFVPIEPERKSALPLLMAASM
jgi:hypothetical protein